MPQQQKAPIPHMRDSMTIGAERHQIFDRINGGQIIFLGKRVTVMDMDEAFWNR